MDLDIASLVGTVLGLVMVVFGIVSSDGGVSNFGYFMDLPSIIITIGGSISGTLASHKLPDFTGGLKSMSLAFK
jgi:chemotaxis protein MotA